MHMWQAAAGVTITVGVAFLLIFAGGGTGEERTDPDGRFQFGIVADYIKLDGDGRPIFGEGGGLERTCIADAFVVLQGSTVERVVRASGESIRAGESVETIGSSGVRDGQQIWVYRDGNGALKEGCDPASWELDREMSSDPG